jgi:hypothetical protein
LGMTANALYAVAFQYNIYSLIFKGP